MQPGWLYVLRARVLSAAAARPVLLLLNGPAFVTPDPTLKTSGKGTLPALDLLRRASGRRVLERSYRRAPQESCAC